MTATLHYLRPQPQRRTIWPSVLIWLVLPLAFWTLAVWLVVTLV